MNNMTNEEYHAHGAIGSTSLKLGLIDSWTLFNRKLFGMSPTNSMKLGTVTHELLAKMIDPTTVLEYSVNARGLGDKTVSVAVMNNAKSMANSVYTMYGDMLKGSFVERSFFSKYRESIDVKCRPDYLIDDVVYDLKTTQSLSDKHVEYAIRDYHYDISAAFYIMVLGLCGVKVSKFRLIFVESGGCGLVRMFEFSSKRLEEATNKCVKILDAQTLHIEGMPYNVVPKVI